MKKNRKQRRAEAKRAKQSRPKHIPSRAAQQAEIDKLKIPERAEALSYSLQELCHRYAPPGNPGLEAVAINALTATASIYAVGTGETEDVFIARCRTFYQQTAAGMKEAQQQIITKPDTGLVGADGLPLG